MLAPHYGTMPTFAEADLMRYISPPLASWNDMLSSSTLYLDEYTEFSGPDAQVCLLSKIHSLSGLNYSSASTGDSLVNLSRLHLRSISTPIPYETLVRILARTSQYMLSPPQIMRTNA